MSLSFRSLLPYNQDTASKNTFYSCQQVLVIFQIHLHNVIKRYLSNSGACFQSNKEKHEKMRYVYVCMYY